MCPQSSLEPIYTNIILHDASDSHDPGTRKGLDDKYTGHAGCSDPGDDVASGLQKTMEYSGTENVNMVNKDPERYYHNVPMASANETTARSLLTNSKDDEESVGYGWSHDTDKGIRNNTTREPISRQSNTDCTSKVSSSRCQSEVCVGRAASEVTWKLSQSYRLATSKLHTGSWGTGCLGMDIRNHGYGPEHKTRNSDHVSHQVDSAGVECPGGHHKQTLCGDSQYDRLADDSGDRSACSECFAKGHVQCSNDSTGPTTCVQCPRYLCV